MNLNFLAKALNLEIPAQNMPLTGVSIDSRQVMPGEVFFALKGERFDGHDYIHDAIAKGAAAVVCSKNQAVKIPAFKVNDTLEALSHVAYAYRSKLTCPVIALTGSNGKTTVKEMIASILPAPSFATPGNLNNHIGVPLSILKLKPKHRYAVLELGANHQGEIAHTVALAKPIVTLINNIAPAHVQGFGSIEGVARAKGEIYQGLMDNGTAVVNQDDDYCHYWDNQLENKHVLRFSTKTPESVHAKDIRLNDNGQPAFRLVTPAGERFIQLQVPGLHNVSNALAAAACTYALNIPFANIVEGLAQFTGVSGRMTFLTGKHQCLVIDDTYNANLRSAISALAVLANCKGRRIFVFGDMGELGDYSKTHHQEVGEAARKLGIDDVFTIGADSEVTSRAFGSHARHYQHQQQLLQDLLPCLNQETTVLVKGSRAAAMEKVVRQIVG